MVKTNLRFSAWYGIVVGLLMFGQWGFFLVAGLVPELQTEPIRIAFHLVAEFASAAMLIAGGIGLLRNKTWARPISLFAAGMLAYTVIVSPGYFAQQGQFSLVAMFALLLVSDVANIAFLLKA
jgi:hypothetical protein